MLKIVSILGLIVMVVAIVGLYKIGVLFSAQPIAIALQALAVVLLIWARITFGLRSFHPAANPTEGGLVRTGPYRYVRHPIYTAACLFGWAGILVHLSLASVSWGVLLFLGALVRMLSEERLVKQRYPEYVEYSKVTNRRIPHVF